MIRKFKNGNHYLGDSLGILPTMQDCSVDLVLTDPPYFIDGMGSDWDSQSLEASTKKASIVGGRPVGMKFDRQQGYKFQAFMAEVSAEIFRVLKPGAFFISFSQGRLYHRLAVAAEDSGFEIRDLMAWHHNGQAKAFSQTHFIRKMTNLTAEQREELSQSMLHLKTPQLKPQLEPMVLAQKPREGTFVENWQKYRVGLMDARQTLDGSFPGNLMPVARPSKQERGEANHHLTVKPVSLLAHLIGLFSGEGQVVLDPFVGSGSTALAAIKTGRQFITIERDEGYFELASQRITGALKAELGLESRS
jgi:site-specific DNA-methyltransferase (adenine-specific)